MTVLSNMYLQELMTFILDMIMFLRDGNYFSFHYITGARTVLRIFWPFNTGSYIPNTDMTFYKMKFS